MNGVVHKLMLFYHQQQFYLFPNKHLILNNQLMHNYLLYQRSCFANMLSRLHVPQTSSIKNDENHAYNFRKTLLNAFHKAHNTLMHI